MPSAIPPKLTREGVIEAAMRVVDADGLQSFSLSAVASTLGCSAASLGRHVGRKEDLLFLMRDAVMRTAIPVVHGKEGWREKLSRICRAQAGVYLAHPWAAEVPLHDPTLTPGFAAQLDAVMCALSRAPIPTGQAFALSLQVAAHAHWWGAFHAAHRRDLTEEIVGHPEPAVHQAVMAMFITSARFPALRSALDAGGLDHPVSLFDLGLERLLDGIAHLVDPDGGDSAPSPSEGANTDFSPEEASLETARRAVEAAERALERARHHLAEIASAG